MPILNIHTHFVSEEPFQAVRNIMPGQKVDFNAGLYSVGIHPWYIKRDMIEDLWNEVETTSQQENVLFIGETGIDKVCNIPIETQTKIFERHIALSESLRKPLIIHSVRATTEMIRLKKQFCPVVPWIIHGFRGKKELASELINHGFCLSFGEHYRKETLGNIPISSLFIETDDSRTGIDVLYKRAAEIRCITVTELVSAVQNNIKKLLGNRYL